MIIRIGGTIPCAEYGNLQVSWEIDVPEIGTESAELMVRTESMLLNRYESLWAQFADKPLVKDLKNAREVRIERLLEKVGMWFSSGWITKEWHDNVVKQAPSANNYLLSKWEEELDRIGQEKKKEATDKRKIEKDNPSTV